MKPDHPDLSGAAKQSTSHRRLPDGLNDNSAAAPLARRTIHGSLSLYRSHRSQYVYCCIQSIKLKIFRLRQNMRTAVQCQLELSDKKCLYSAEDSQRGGRGYPRVP